ncbi:MAG: glycine zipper domain protein [Proteobacteria bacterium]|nr:glycine zipper domain protein [Pseudomonadota bacterium]
MKTTQRLARIAACGVLLLALAACDGMSRRDKDTAIGAAVGGVAGSVLTGGDAVGTVGGAVVGGVIGNQVGKPEKNR